MLKKDIFKKIIVNFHETHKKNLVLRDLKLPVDINKIITLYGTRRGGKTYLFYQTIQELYNKNIEFNKIIYINFLVIS